MTDSRIWGFADLVCRSCRAAMVLQSPEMMPSESNLTGQTEVVCVGCGSRVTARELPQSQQNQIAARLRLLLESDDFIPVHLAMSSLFGRRQNENFAQTLTPEPPVGRPQPVTLEHHAGPPKSNSEGTVAEQPRVVRADPDAVEWQQFLLVARLSPPEAKAVAETMRSNVGEPIQDRARRASFSAVRVRNRYFVASTGTEIFTDLMRFKSAGRAVTIGFSREEVVALAFGIPAKHELLEVSDPHKNIVGLLRFERNKVRFGSVEVFRRRPAPVK